MSTDASTEQEALANPRRTSRRAAVRRYATSAVKGLAGLVVMVGLWELLRRLDVLPRSAVPSTAATLTALRAGLFGGDLLSATGHTLLAWAAGLGLASLIGLPLGFALGLSRWADAATREVVDFLRPIPSVAFVPVALVFLGFGLKMEVVLVLIGAVWPIVFNTRYGVQDVDPKLVESGQSLHYSDWTIVRRIKLVAATPAILTGLRTASAIALILTVSAETLAVPEGLGNVISQSATTGSTADAYAAIVITGFLGVVMNMAIATVRTRLVPWSTRAGDREV